MNEKRLYKDLTQGIIGAGMIENRVIVEIKATKGLTEVEEAQLLIL